jgi:hypothetical protein
MLQEPDLDPGIAAQSLFELEALSLQIEGGCIARVCQRHQDAEMTAGSRRRGQARNFQVAYNRRRGIAAQKVSRFRPVQKLPGEGNQLARFWIRWIEAESDSQSEILTGLNPAKTQEKGPEQVIAKKSPKEGVTDLLWCEARLPS